MSREDMIDDLITADVKEIVDAVKAGNEYTPGDIRHILAYGRGYDTWTDEEVLKEWKERHE